MRNDLIELIKAISYLAETLIITNGTLLSKENAVELVKGGLDFIEFSIDLPEQHNDFLRGGGTYRKAMAGIDILLEEKKKQESKTPQITIRPLITKANCRMFKTLYHWSMDKGLNFEFVFLRDWYKALIHTRFEDKRIGYYQPGLEGQRQNKIVADMVLTAKECRKIWEEFYLLKWDSNSSWFMERIRRILRNIDHILNSFIYFDCSRSRNSVLIDPYGDLYVCELLDYKYGNCITNGPVSWFTDNRKRIREKIVNGLLPICRECNRYGHKRPLLSSYNYLTRYYGSFFHKSHDPPNPKSVRWKLF